jgi:hypothetical protein
MLALVVPPEVYDDLDVTRLCKGSESVVNAMLRFYDHYPGISPPWFFLKHHDVAA